jgi:hypothetical protein
MAPADLIHEQEEQEQEHLGGGRFNRLLGVVFVAVAMLGGVALALGIQSSGIVKVRLLRNQPTTQAQQPETGARSKTSPLMARSRMRHQP